MRLEELSAESGVDLERLVRRFDPKQIIEREQAAGQPFGPFHRHWLLERAPEKVRRMLEKARLHPELVATRQPFLAPDAQDFPPANLRAAINTTTTETNLWDPALWAPIPALDMKAGKKYTVEFGGVIGTTGTPTIAFRARCGTNNSAPPTGTDLGISPTVTLETIAAQPFYGWFSMGIRSIGVAAAGATVTGNGFAILPTAAASAGAEHCVYGGAIPTTIDHTIAQALGVSITWGTSSASNTLTPQWMSYFSTA
jgi:hypothetical protein